MQYAHQDAAIFIALQGKRHTIKTYIDEISKSVEKIDEADILDHVTAMLLPIVTSLRNNMAGSRDNEVMFKVLTLQKYLLLHKRMKSS